MTELGNRQSRDTCWQDTYSVRQKKLFTLSGFRYNLDHLRWMVEMHLQNNCVASCNFITSIIIIITSGLPLPLQTASGKVTLKFSCLKSPLIWHIFAPFRVLDVKCKPGAQNAWYVPELRSMYLLLLKLLNCYINFTWESRHFFEDRQTTFQVGPTRYQEDDYLSVQTCLSFFPFDTFS